eukprot:g8582.t1
MAAAWRSLASALYFLDALSGALLIPVLPAVVGELLGMEKASPFATSWVLGVLVCCYFVGRSGTLGVAARACSGSPRAAAAAAVGAPSLLRIGVLLPLSAAAYVACGVVVVDGREQQKYMSRSYVLLYFALLRTLAGCIAAGHRWFACRCLDHAARLEPITTVATEGAGPFLGKSWNESTGALGGLVAGCAFSGTLYQYSERWPASAGRPTLLLCLAAAAAHAPALISALHVARKKCCGSGGGSDSGGAMAGGYATVRGETPGGSDAEVELMGRPPWSARDDSFDSSSGRVAAAAGSTGAGAKAEASAHDDGEGGESISIPGRYLRGCAGDVVEAERRWRLTLEWRAAERIDEVLREPQPHFEVIKRHYPHFIHRRARNGCPVWIELPGRIDLPAIRSAGVSPEALQRHYVFVTEYMWGVLEPDFENGQAVTVLDVHGLGMRDLAGEALGFVKKATAIVQDHYVERSNRMFIVNAPSYFSMIWRVIRPMLNERTQAKIGIINTDTKKIAAALLEYIAPENLPRQYGGTCPLDLGESEEEADLRAYVESLAGSSSNGTAPASRPVEMDEDDLDEEVEVDLRAATARSSLQTAAKTAARAAAAAGEGSRPRGSPAGGAAARAGAGAKARESQSQAAGQGDGREENGGASESGAGPGAARRVIGSVRGALGWAGGKLAWRRSAVAHLGDENGFVYDTEQHRWVLRGEAGGGVGGGRAGGKAGAGGGAGGFEAVRASDEGADNVDRRRQSRPVRVERNRSVSSEEMTVLAIQAAHHSLAEVGTKLSPVPSEFSAVPGVGVAGAARASSFRSPGGMAGYHLRPHPASVSNAEVRFPCLRLFGRRASRPDAAVVLYALSTAVREALPVWLLAGVGVGGIGASPPRVGVVFAAGAFIAEAGRWCASRLRDRGKEGGAGRRLRHAVWARLASVAGLGLLFLLPKFSPTSSVDIPSDVVWLAVTVVVATNYASLDLCTAAATAALAVRSQQQRAEFVNGGMSSSSHGGSGGGGGRPDEGTRAKSSVSSDHFCGGNWRPPPEPRSAPVTSGSILFVGDVLGSAAGPLVLALALWTGCRSPLDASFWLVLCLVGDLWLALGAREAEPRHERLLGGEDQAEEEEEEHARAQRFAQFV